MLHQDWTDTLRQLEAGVHIERRVRLPPFRMVPRRRMSYLEAISSKAIADVFKTFKKKLPFGNH